MLTVFFRVFKNVRYVTLALLTFFLSTSLVLLLPNLDLLIKIFGDTGISMTAKLALLATLYGSILTSYTAFSAGYTLVALLLFSINLTLLVFYIRRAQHLSGNTSAHATNVVGLASGILGIGCAACGSVILSGVAASVGAAGFLAILPLGGGEFALVGIVLLLFSISYLGKKIHDPLVCPSQR